MSWEIFSTRFKPTSLSHQPLCQWCCVWPLTCGTRSSGGPSCVWVGFKGVHIIWASDCQSINHGSPATFQFNLSVLFFLSPLPAPVSQPCTQKHTHTPRAVRHTKADDRDFIWLRRWVWALLCVLPPPPPHLWSPSPLSSTCVHASFFCRSGWPSVTEQRVFNGVGWHSRTHAWQVLGSGWTSSRCESQATLSGQGSGHAASVIHKVDAEVGNCAAALCRLYWTVENHWWPQEVMWRLA